MFSEDQDIDNITSEIDALQVRLNKSKADYIEILEKVMIDFKNQKRRLMLNLRHLRYELRKDICCII
jgi:hypothetical protein